MENIEAKITQFRDVTGVEDPSLCYEILEAHGWNLDVAVNSVLDRTVTQPRNGPANSTDQWVPTMDPAPSRGWLQPSQGHELGFSDSLFEGLYKGDDRYNLGSRQTQENTMNYHGFRSPFMDNDEYLNSYLEYRAQRDHHHGTSSTSRPQSGSPGLVWKIISLPISIAEGMSRAVGYGMSVAGDVLSYIGIGGRHGEPVMTQQQRAYPDPFSYGHSAGPLIPMQSEGLAFVRSFEQQYGQNHPSFVGLNFMDALRRAKDDYQFLFVYLHYPDHPYTAVFCENTLCSDLVVQYLDANFVCWGADVNCNEGFHMSSALRATTFPFCALVISTSNENLAMMQQVEGPVSKEELVATLQKAVEDQGSALMTARLEEEEERLSNRQLREEQDAAYQVALTADQERDWLRELGAELAARVAEETERTNQGGLGMIEATERESASQSLGEQNACTGDVQLQKGPNVTEILIRFPNGDQKQRRFLCTEKIQTIYNYIDSLGLVAVGGYKIITTFPRRVYGAENMDLTLKEAGLHPQASLFLELQ